jgi:hypothetical protein
LGYQIKENEMGAACKINGIKERCMQDFDRETSKKKATRKI